MNAEEAAKIEKSKRRSNGESGKQTRTPERKKTRNLYVNWKLMINLRQRSTPW